MCMVDVAKVIPAVGFLVQGCGVDPMLPDCQGPIC